MQIPKKVWQKYKDALAAVDQKAAAKMEEYIRALGEIDSIPWSAVQYAAALTDVYGEAAGAAACEMYDATAEASGAKVKPAEMAELPKIGEVAKVVRGAFKNGSEKVVPGAVGRMVKQVGADTTLKNAQRDGAEFAWIPAGDTCAFCLTLASRGWQKISKKSLKNGHAEHIHANCDCTYAVRFDKKTTVEGYEPEKYREMYENAEGETAAEKMNSMRREAEATEHERMYVRNSNIVPLKALDSPEFVAKFDGLTGVKDVDHALYESAKEILNGCSGSNLEYLYLIDAENGKYIHRLTTSKKVDGVNYERATFDAIEEAHRNNRKIIAIHNHPNGLPPTLDDGTSAFTHGYDIGVVVGHNLEVWTYGQTDASYSEAECQDVHEGISKILQFEIEFDDSIWYNQLKVFGMEVVRK